jgi:hypothetical protein
MPNRVPAGQALLVRFHVEIIDLESDDVIASEHADDWAGALGLGWHEWDRVYPRRQPRGPVVVESARAETA